MFSAVVSEMDWGTAQCLDRLDLSGPGSVEGWRRMFNPEGQIERDEVQYLPFDRGAHQWYGGQRDEGLVAGLPPV